MGVVAIGRNEGSQLRACLESCFRQVRHVIYVDSGSTDNSIALARSLGAEVVELDTSTAFSAARARNQGLRHLRAVAPSMRYVQFIDGDCQLVQGWIKKSLASFKEAPQLAVVCGRRSERYPDTSIYNRLTDLEWDTPVGEAESCGGDALMRIDALEQVGGYNPVVVAGEEPELCFRLRQNGWRVRRIDAAMTLHDVDLSHFYQWWRRAVRAGHAYGQAVALHGRSSERFRLRPTLSIWAWAAGWPILILLSCVCIGPFALAFFAAYPLLAMKIAVSQRRRRERRWSDACLYAIFCVIAKFAQCQGQCQWWYNWFRRRQPMIIEYHSGNQ